jgi:ABC-type enterochelin transport system substrate-binding protein
MRAAAATVGAPRSPGAPTKPETQPRHPVPGGPRRPAGAFYTTPMQETPQVAGTGNLSQLRLTTAPRRVVSLVPSVTGSLFDLGLGQVLVAVTDYCVYPPRGVATLPKMGGTKNPDRDRIVALAPDLVIANLYENRR